MITASEWLEDKKRERRKAVEERIKNAPKDCHGNTIYDSHNRKYRLDGVLDALAQIGGIVNRQNGYYQAQCPVHGDTNPSLTITPDADGLYCMLYCHAGCDIKNIRAALESQGKLDGADEPVEPAVATKSDFHNRDDGDNTTIYDYVDENGKLLYQVIRSVDRNGKKKFQQRQPKVNGDWSYKITQRKVLYRLPKVLQQVKSGKAVIIVEGEKDVHTLDRLNDVVATTNSGGAGKWDDAYTQYLAGAQVYMIADNDAAGQNHVIDIFKSFRSHGLSFKLIQLPKIDELGDGADVTDWVEAGHTLDELRQAVQDAPLYLPDIKTFKFHTAAELQTMNLPEPRWIVKDLFPVGLTVLAAQKKVGKSCLALQAAVAVAKGKPLFEQLNVDAGAVLYYAMEQSKNLNKYRLKLSLGEGIWSERLYIRSINDPFPRMDMGGMDELEFTILSIPNIKLVIIDTWQRVAPVNSHKSLNAYERDTMSMDPLHALAHKYGIALVLITHEKKSLHKEHDEFDRVMGSQGMTGVPDHVIMITRKRDDVNAKIMTISRVGREIRWALRFNDETLTWTLLGDAGEVCRSQERQQIYEILREMDKPLSPSDVTALLEEQGTDKNYNAVKALLFKMEHDGEVEKTGRGLYRHKRKLPNVTINNNPNIPKEILIPDDALPVEPPNTVFAFDVEEGA